MYHPPRRRALFGLAAGPFLLPSAPALSQTLDRPARIVVGFPPGGAADIVARLLAERLRGTYAPQVIVDNRPGAAARIAVETVRSGPPDGTSILFTPESMVSLYPHIYPRTLRYDGLRDFVPVGTVTSIAFAFVVQGANPARDFPAFVEWARAQPGEVPYATPAAGSTPHFVAERIGRRLGLRLQHVAYRGTGPALLDLGGGRISGVMGVVGDMVEQHRAGTIRTLAVSGPRRAASLPEVPTFAELGMPELTAQEHYVLLLPVGVPPALVAQLAEALAVAQGNPELRAAFARIEQTPVTTAPDALLAHLRSERERWATIVRETGYTAEE